MNNRHFSLILLLSLLLLTACSSIQIQITQNGTTDSQDATASAQGGKSSTSGQQASASNEENTLSQRLFTQINHNRAANHLAALVWNNTLAKGARLHSQKMVNCGLTHACPSEPQPCDRVQQEGIQYMACGENVGTATYPTTWAGVQAIDQGMMSEVPPEDGHRKNLLSTDFHQIGIGIIVANNNTVWVTEDFAN
jgi:uncharacterized protein YkwD